MICSTEWKAEKATLDFHMPPLWNRFTGSFHQAYRYLISEECFVKMLFLQAIHLSRFIVCSELKVMAVGLLLSAMTSSKRITHAVIWIRVATIFFLWSLIRKEINVNNYVRGLHIIVNDSKYGLFLENISSKHSYNLLQSI